MPTSEVDKARNRRYYQEHREQILAAQRTRSAALRDEKRTYNRAYYEAHKETAKAATRARRGIDRELERLRYAANPLPKRTAALRWEKLNPDKVRLRNQRRRALENGAAGRCTIEQLRARVAFYGGLCWVCLALGVGRPRSYEAIDHVVPLSRGGTNWPANFRPICTRHNSQKKNAMPQDFLASGRQPREQLAA